MISEVQPRDEEPPRKVDAALVRHYEELPTSELKTIVGPSRNDYTPEAVAVAEYVLAGRTDIAGAADLSASGQSPSASHFGMDESPNYKGPLAFIRKHFNGDYSLGRSYWITTGLISLLAPQLGILILSWLSADFSARYVSVGVLFVTAVGVIAWGWAVIGTWASANKHVSRGGKQFWARAAKVMIALGVLKTFGEIGNMSGSLAEHWKIALGHQLGPRISIQVRADGKSILLAGGINDGTAETLSTALDIAPAVTTVVLHSDGGWVKQGNMIAKVIAERRLNTYVEEECTSACTIAFLAGKERSAAPTARIGFHSFKSAGVSGTASTSSDLEATRNTYRRAGLSPSFIAKVANTSNDKVWYPSHDEMLAEGVLSRLSFGGETATIATSMLTREKLASEFQKIPAFAALSMKYPSEFDRIIDKAWAKVEARKSDAEVMAAGREQIGQLMSRLLPIASDASLVNYNALILEQAETLRRKSPTACVELFFPTGKPMNTAALLPPQFVTRELTLMNELILGSDARHAKHLSKQESERAVMKVLMSLSRDQVEMLDSEEMRAASPPTACASVIAYLRALDATPERDRARLLRAIYSTNQ